MKRFLFGLCLAAMPVTMMAQQVRKMWVNMPTSIVGSLEKSTNEELYAMVANADAKTLSEVAFEIDKRAGKLRYEAKEARRGLKAEMRKKFEAMSIADRQNFMSDFRKSYNDQVDALSVAEAKKLDIELKGHPWFVGVQCHPEFTSRLTRPNPVILGFIKASLANHVK